MAKNVDFEVVEKTNHKKYLNIKNYFSKFKYWELHFLKKMNYSADAILNMNSFITMKNG